MFVKKMWGMPYGSSTSFSTKKEDFMQSQKVGEMLGRAAGRLPTSTVLAARVLSDTGLLRILKKYGAGKPCFILYGEPGNGKTSTVRSLLGKNVEVKFVDGYKEVKKAIKEIAGTKGGGDEKSEKEILFLDNFPEPLSAYKLETGKRCLDFVIDVVSENEESPIVIMTGETNIIAEVRKARSLIGRSLVVQMPKIDKDKELYGIRSYFSTNQAEYLELWNAYHRWAQGNPSEEAEISQKLAQFRQKYYGRYENRQTGLVFCYFYAMLRLSDFLEAEYGRGTAMKDIEKNVRELFEWEKSSANIRQSYEVDIWNEFVEDGGIRNVLEPADSVCRLLLDSACDEPEQYMCHNCGDEPCGSYHPMDLRLPADSAAAMLIENPRLISGFPKHVVCDGPLLMIRKESLLEMLNTYLEAYSRKKGVSVRSIAPKKLTRELFRHNLCLFEYVGTGHNTYTFGMKDERNNNIRVIFLKLTMGQFQYLKGRVKKPVRIRSYNERAVLEMNQCLKYFCENVQSLVGEVGAPSMVLDEAY